MNEKFIHFCVESDNFCNKIKYEKWVLYGGDEIGALVDITKDINSW